MPATTGNFSSVELLGHEEACKFDVINREIAQAIGERFVEVGLKREHPITVVVQLNGAEVFNRALPGADVDEQLSWINRKARVVNLTHHSTMYERVNAEELGIDWHAKHGVEDATHAIHGGGFPLITTAGEFMGVVLVSGLPQVEDHMLVYEILAQMER